MKLALPLTLQLKHSGSVEEAMGHNLSDEGWEREGKPEILGRPVQPKLAAPMLVIKLVSVELAMGLAWLASHFEDSSCMEVT